MGPGLGYVVAGSRRVLRIRGRDQRGGVGMTFMEIYFAIKLLGVALGLGFFVFLLALFLIVRFVR